ncbi:sigma factor-like helix-turn-helix DNA-binding protein [Lachnospiraceae bacterium 29-91]
MAFNKAREERKWKQWKEKEESLLRTLGMEEESIQELRRSDWEEFKAERRFQDHRASFPQHFDWESAVEDEREIDNISELLDSIDDEHLFHILLDTDRGTLQFLLMRMMGFSVPEIAEKLKISEYAVYNRIKRLKKKIKNFISCD